MAKISDYPKTSKLENSNVFILDGENGTKGILAGELGKALLSLMGTKDIMSNVNIENLDEATEINKNSSLLISTTAGNGKLKLEDGIFDLLDQVADVSLRRNLWRGKNLGASVTAAQYNEINAGTFKGMFLGDYWEIGGRIWRIVDFDYWFNSGDTACTAHHLTIMPDSTTDYRKMNDAVTSEGAYVNSDLYKTGLTATKSIVNSAFNSNHVLSYRSYLQNATTDGYASGGAWFTSTVEIPNEPMVFGYYIQTPAGNGDRIVSRYTNDFAQLAAFRLNPRLNISSNRSIWWLRDVVTKKAFSVVRNYGTPTYSDSDNDQGIRPVFGICKQNTL